MNNGMEQGRSLPGATNAGHPCMPAYTAWKDTFSSKVFGGYIVRTDSQQIHKGGVG